MASSNDIRANYLHFFQKRGHTVIPSASLVPQNDPTTLFTGSGMQPLLPYLLGQPHAQGARLVDSQKCFRQMDIEEVGDNRHTTFFEMLGNWSLGDYFKDDQLRWFFTFLIDAEEGLGLDPARLYVTVFDGDVSLGIPQDEESIAIWKTLFEEKGISAAAARIGSEEEGYRRGMHAGERIFSYDASKNWWSRAGVPENMPPGEPGGPDSEVFYDFETQHDPSFGEQCHPNCDCGRFLEIGNSVFMEYLKLDDGSFGPLPQKNVDFGGGLERLTAAVQGSQDVFLIDSLGAIIRRIEERAKHPYTTQHAASYRIVADHLRGAVFMIADGVEPSNTEQGYVLRRLIRRAIRHLDVLGVTDLSMTQLSDVVVRYYSSPYPEVGEAGERIADALKQEEERFRAVLQRGMKEFERFAAMGEITGKDAFTLFSTYGFPFEMTQELAAEEGLSVDEAAFKEQMRIHQETSRAGAEQKFKGGLADHSEQSVKYHTATHLLHQALRDVLGPEVYQRGSNITPQRLRFDFSFDRKMTDSEKQQVERIVNERIKEALPVTYYDVPKDEAEQLGAVGLFGEKYGDTVRLYQIGDPPYSIEYCGGPHVSNTGELGRFAITKEEAISAGVRRIKASLA